MLLKELSVTNGLVVLGGCDPFKPEEPIGLRGADVAWGKEGIAPPFNMFANGFPAS